MLSKSHSSPKLNPWGDDHPEKLSQSDPKTIGLGQQIKGLFSPDAVLSQIMGEKGQEKHQPSKETPPVQRSENIVFSLSHHSENKQVVEETQVLLRKLKEQITVLEKQERNLSSELTKVKVETLPPKTSLYYMRFLEWLLVTVKQLRIKVEEGRAWLETFSQRKKKKAGYWQKYKKHGTTFGLSHERSLATQTG